MRLVNRYILRQIWPPTLVAFLAISVVMISGTLQQQVTTLLKDLPIAQITFGDLARISAYSLPTLVGFILPITFLLGIMLTFGRMAQQSEITALKAAGIPLKRLVMPVIGLGAVVSGLCFLAQDQAQPWAYKHLTKLLRSDLPLRITLDMLPTGTMHAYGDWRVYIGSRDPDGVFHNIVVLQPQDDGLATAFYADQARLIKEEGVTKLEMGHGMWIKSSKQGENVVRGDFDRLTKSVPPLQPLESVREREGMTLHELLASHAELTDLFNRTQGLPAAMELYKHRVEISDRLSFPLMCLAVSFMAAPIGVRTRRAGRSYAFASGLAIVAAYFVMRNSVQVELLLPLPLRICLDQIPNVALAAAGSLLLWRVDRV